MCLFLEIEHIWSWRLGKHSEEAVEEEFPPVAWLVGNVRAQTSPRDPARALNTSVCCSREGESRPKVSQGPYQGFPIPAALASSSRGKPQGRVGGERGSFGFCSPGRKAFQGRQPAP